MDTKTKIYGYLLLGGLAASPPILIGAWGVDVYSANKENCQRIASALETKLIVNLDKFSLEPAEGKCPERGQRRYTLFVEERTEGEVCLELKMGGCRSVDYEECPRMLEIDRVQWAPNNI